MKNHSKLQVSTLISAMALLSAQASMATDFYWGGSDGNFTNPANWFTNGVPANAVPGPTDNANFTNDAYNTVTWTANATSANVLINDSTWQRLAVGSSTWWVTNGLTATGKTAGAPSFVYLNSGTLVVTNAAGTGTYLAGSAGAAGSEFDIDGGGTLTVDQFYLNNNSSYFFLDNGTVNILHGSVFSNYYVRVGVTAQSTMNILGGTNIAAYGPPTILNASTLNVVGPGTVWSNAAYTYLTSNSKLVVSNGATYLSGSSYVDIGQTNTSIVVTGPNSAWTVGGEFIIGQYNGNLSNQLAIANGAQFTSSGKVVVDQQGAFGAGTLNNYNTILVTGTGSVMHVGDYLGIGSEGASKGYYNQLIVSNGGAVKIDSVGSTHALNMGYDSGAGASNSVTITGPGSILQINRTDGFVLVGGHTSNEWMFIKDHGVLEANRLLVQSQSFISNSGGVFQFTTNAANILIDALSGSSISLTDGTISFRAIPNATVSLAGYPFANVQFSGNNTFQLNNATNTSVTSYTFDSVDHTGTATNYQRLALANGGRWQSSTLTIGSGGALIGNGTVDSASVTNLGTIAPGFSAGSLTFTSNLVLGASSKLQMEIGGINLVDYDRLIVGGNVTVTGTLAIAMINGFSTTPGETFTLIDNQGMNAISGLFNGLTNNAFIDASANGMSAFFNIRYDGGTGNDLVLIATIPEPSALSLLWLGLGWFMFLGRRKRK